MKIEKKKIERIEYREVFIADDGTEFANRENCEKYEKSCEGVINTRLQSLKKAECSYITDYLNPFCFEELMMVVYIADANDLTAVNMWIQHHGATGAFGAKDLKMLGSDAVGTYQVLSDDSYGGMYFYGSLESLRERLHRNVDLFFDEHLNPNPKTETENESEETK